MNIAQIMTEGRGQVLNSVEIVDVYELRDAGGSPCRSILAQDSSMKTILKIWGNSAHENFTKGEKITLQGIGSKGGISVNEWKGKKSLNCNDCEIVRGDLPGQAAAPAQQPAPAAATAPASLTPAATAQAAPAASGGLSSDRLADAQCAEIAKRIKILQPVAQELGVSPDTLFLGAVQMTGSAPEWWFGEKWPGKGS